ncbi:hypothetical protein PoB_005130400 [Plakobranchus ocellatus]|uniref:Lipocalin/cytosolic fatty-acid binding domain-containing protein n=1 Tax=Plakobranchus ocellatus TaxID=259542 RepID=A0AAV4BX64_9GAST|nr:hypothetical protein PoB_005130400 [Plakobranchus ocellatus]
MNLSAEGKVGIPNSAKSAELSVAFRGETLWIYTREPSVTPSDLFRLKHNLEADGVVDVSSLIRVNQSGCPGQ